MAECCHRVPNSQTPTVLALTPSLFTANEKGISLSRSLRLCLFHFGRSDIGFSIGHIRCTFSVTCLRRIILHPGGGRWQFVVFLPRLPEWCLHRSCDVFCSTFGAHIMERAPSEDWKQSQFAIFLIRIIFLYFVVFIPVATSVLIGNFVYFSSDWGYYIPAVMTHLQGILTTLLCYFTHEDIAHSTKKVLRCDWRDSTSRTFSSITVSNSQRKLFATVFSSQDMKSSNQLSQNIDEQNECIEQSSLEGSLARDEENHWWRKLSSHGGEVSLLPSSTNDGVNMVFLIAAVLLIRCGPESITLWSAIKWCLVGLWID